MAQQEQKAKGLAKLASKRAKATKHGVNAYNNDYPPRRLAMVRTMIAMEPSTTTSAKSDRHVQSVVSKDLVAGVRTPANKAIWNVLWSQSHPAKLATGKMMIATD